MDLSIMNSSLEYAMQTIEEEVNYNDNFQSPTWSCSDVISNNEELLSFIGDNNFNFHFMETLDKLNSPSKVDKESDIRDSLVEFLQEQLKPSEPLINSRNVWTDFDINTQSTTCSSYSSNVQDVKPTFNNNENLQNPNEHFLKCNICPYVASNLGNLNIHLESHSSKEYITSDLFLNLTKANNLDFLEDSETPAFTYNCLKNNYNVVDTISTCNNKSVVTDLQHSPTIFKCEICSYSAEKKCLFKLHMLMHNKGNFSCAVCGYQVHRNVNYVDHIKQHVLSSYECPLCCYTTSEGSAVAKHLVQHENFYRCLVCTDTAALDQCYGEPIIKSSEFSYTSCDYKTNFETNLRKDLPTQYNRKLLQCDLCGYTSAYKKMIKEHCSKHSGSYFKCNTCDFKTVYRNNFKTHKMKHIGEKKFVCHVCGFKFAQRSNLKAHIATHVGQRNYECYLCDYKATQKINLKAHIITHIGERNLACNVCNYKALNRSTLKTHMTVHNADKIYDCSICNYKTAYKSGLRRHLRVHTGEKKFLCEICEYKTSRKDYINRHMLKHTGEKNFSCNFCDYKTAYRNSLNVHIALVHTTDL